MEVRLLGPLSAYVDGVELSLGGRKQRAIFALLALDAGRIVSLDRLVHELWCDAPPARATLALQSYISRLRRILAAAGEAGPAPRIETRPPGWVLVIAPEQIDVTRFVTGVEAGRALFAEARPDAAVLQLRQALALWRGDVVVDLRDARSTHATVAGLEQLRLGAVELLFEAALASGDVTIVTEGAPCFIADNPYREGAWLSLAVALYRSGRQAESLAELSRLRAILSADLGLEPSPAVRRLEAQVLRQDPGLDAPNVDAPLHVRHITDSVLQTVSDVAHDRDLPMTGADEPLIVGRRDERRRLAAAVADAVAGRGRLVSMEGSSGAGKTTLLHAVAADMQAADGIALTAEGAELGMPALWPWIGMVRQLLDAMPEVGAETPGAAVVASLALPVRPPAHGESGWAIDDVDLSRTRLYRAVVDTLTTARRHRPLAVILDDLRWVDAETRQLLSLALCELITSGILVAVGISTDDHDARHPSPPALEPLSGDAVLRVPLPGLQPAEVAELATRISGAPADPAVTAALHARTGGNPFFVSEVVRLLASERRLHLREVDQCLPEGVRQAVSRRVDRLPEQTVALLTVAALAGREFSVEMIAKVTGLDTEAVLDGCETAVAARMLIDPDDASGLLSFSHDLVRQTLVEAISRDRQSRLRCRIAEAVVPAPRQHSVAPALSQAGRRST